MYLLACEGGEKLCAFCVIPSHSLLSKEKEKSSVFFVSFLLTACHFPLLNLRLCRFHSQLAKEKSAVCSCPPPLTLPGPRIYFFPSCLEHGVHPIWSNDILCQVLMLALKFSHLHPRISTGSMI